MAPFVSLADPFAKRGACALTRVWKHGVYITADRREDEETEDGCESRREGRLVVLDVAPGGEITLHPEKASLNEATLLIWRCRKN